MYHLLEWVRHNRLISSIEIDESHAFLEVTDSTFSRFLFLGPKYTRNRRNPVQVKVKHIKTRKVYDINLVTLLNSSTVIQWNRRMPIPTIKRFIKRYDKAQARADYLTTLPKRMLQRILTLGPRNVVPFLNNGACEDIYLVDNDVNMAVFGLMLFGGRDKVKVVYTDRLNRRTGKVGIQDIVLKTHRNPLPNIDFTLINLDYNGTPKDVWKRLPEIVQAYSTLQHLAVTGACRSFPCYTPEDLGETFLLDAEWEKRIVLRKLWPQAQVKSWNLDIKVARRH